ncbi:hypothetical protein [Azospirillum largimobile]
MIPLGSVAGLTVRPAVGLVAGPGVGDVDGHGGNIRRPARC